MSRKSNVVFNIIIYAVTIALFILVTAVGQRYGDNFWQIVFLLFAGSILAIMVSTLFHELGHLIIGKSKKFLFNSMVVWFFKWYKKGKKTKFCFTLPTGEAGYTEIIPTNDQTVVEDYKKVIVGGLICSLIPAIIGIVPLFLVSLPMWAFCLWAMLLPMGVYSFLDNALPIFSDGEKSDGYLLKSLKNQDDSGVVFANLLKYQALICQGKTPSEINPDLLFDLPQLCEDDPCYYRLLFARYDYYLDLGDFDNAKKTTERLLALEEVVDGGVFAQIKLIALYNACTFDFDEDRADDLTYELEKLLNRSKDLTVLRIKMTYILFVKGDRQMFEPFYNRGIKMASKCQISGLGRFEIKLLDRIKQQYLQK